MNRATCRSPSIRHIMWRSEMRELTLEEVNAIYGASGYTYTAEYGALGAAIGGIVGTITAGPYGGIALGAAGGMAGGMFGSWLDSQFE